MSITEEANKAWYDGAPGSKNPYTRSNANWRVWATEWIRLEDERNDQIASDDHRAAWNKAVKD